MNDSRKQVAHKPAALILSFSPHHQPIQSSLLSCLLQFIILSTQHLLMCSCNAPGMHSSTAPLRLRPLGLATWFPYLQAALQLSFSLCPVLLPASPFSQVLIRNTEHCMLHKMIPPQTHTYLSESLKPVNALQV